MPAKVNINELMKKGNIRMRNPKCVICDEMINRYAILIHGNRPEKNICAACANTIYSLLRDTGGLLDEDDIPGWERMPLPVDSKRRS